ncbi:AarF/UbiB family protein [Serratia ureilytica]
MASPAPVGAGNTCPAPRRKPSAAGGSGLDGPLLAQRRPRLYEHGTGTSAVSRRSPHPGNVMALSGDRVGFIDFGMVGQLSERRRNQLLLLLQAIADRQSKASSTR